MTREKLAAGGECASFDCICKHQSIEWSAETGANSLALKVLLALPGHRSRTKKRKKNSPKRADSSDRSGAVSRKRRAISSLFTIFYQFFYSTRLDRAVGDLNKCAAKFNQFFFNFFLSTRRHLVDGGDSNSKKAPRRLIIQAARRRPAPYRPAPRDRCPGAARPTPARIEIAIIYRSYRSAANNS